MTDLIYFYNEENGELFCSQQYNGEVIPANATLEVPPETKENETVVFENGVWIIKKDYRFTHRKIDADNNIEYITELGDIPEGWELITNEEAEAIEQEKQIQKRSMTKLDFYKYVVQPNGISYNQLKEIIATSEDISAQWDLCSRVYRYNALLNEAVIQQFIPAITKSDLDAIFLEHGQLFETSEE